MNGMGIMGVAQVLLERRTLYWVDQLIDEPKAVPINALEGIALNSLKSSLIRGVLASAVLLCAGLSHGAPISVNESLTFTDPPTSISFANNPFTFSFTGLPTTPLTDASVRIFGLADLGQAGESFDVEVEGDSFGTFNPAAENFDEAFQISQASLANYLSDGTLTIVVNFSAGVNAPLTGDFVTTSISFRAEENTVPEPASLALVGLAMLGAAAARSASRRHSKAGT